MKPWHFTGASSQCESSVILTIESHLEEKDKKDKSTSWHLLTSLWRWWIPVLGEAQNNWGMERKRENSLIVDSVLTICQNISSSYKTLIWIPNATYLSLRWGGYTCVCRHTHVFIWKYSQGCRICYVFPYWQKWRMYPYSKFLITMAQKMQLCCILLLFEINLIDILEK